jgi:hemoglobin
MRSASRSGIEEVVVSQVSDRPDAGGGDGEIVGLCSEGVTRVDGRTMLEHVGGADKVRELAEIFHARVLEDDFLHDMFARGSRAHALHLSHFLEEIMGGRQLYTDLHDGLRGMFEAHRDLEISEEQRQRFVEILVDTLDLADMPEDPRFRDGFAARVEQGSQFSKNLSQPGVSPLDPWPPVGTWDW